MDANPSLLKIAIEATKIAASPLKSAKAGYRSVHVEVEHDVKLQADLESERLIREFLQSETDFPIIGEEEGGDHRLIQSDQPYWVVDPLDGTYNYLREYPQCCVSIGLMKGEEPVVGAVYDFNRDELFTGGPGLPFAVNGTPHQPSWAESMERACITTGFPHDMKRDKETVSAFMDLILKYRKVRMIGSAALSVSYVACGFFDVYYETGVKLWDIAAGLAFARSVGATVALTPWEDQPFNFDIWMAGKPNFIASA